jgi:predicted transcriptional regulator
MRLDETRLRQVLFNLVGNAIKFTHEGGVTVRATATPLSADANAGEAKERSLKSQLVVTVQDTGIGIPRDQQQQIFDAFEQQEGQSSRRYGGTGLGLAISRKLVRMMGGELDVESESGMGSTFTVRLPDVEVTSEEAEEEEDRDDKYDEALHTVVRAGKASTSYLQRKLRIGYSRAARIMDELEENGIIPEKDGTKAREVLVSKGALEGADAAEQSQPTNDNEEDQETPEEDENDSETEESEKKHDDTEDEKDVIDDKYFDALDDEDPDTTLP